MITSILINNCLHLEEYSSYNRNYYLLPFYVNGCNIIFEYYAWGEFQYYALGEFDYESDIFEIKYYLNVEENSIEFIFDSELLSEENKLT